MQEPARWGPRSATPVLHNPLLLAVTLQVSCWLKRLLSEAFPGRSAPQTKGLWLDTVAWGPRAGHIPNPKPGADVSDGDVCEALEAGGGFS